MASVKPTIESIRDWIDREEDAEALEAFRVFVVQRLRGLERVGIHELEECGEHSDRMRRELPEARIVLGLVERRISKIREKPRKAQP